MKKTSTSRKKIYFHIGMHKTGTTSIQYALHDNASALKKSGFLYPKTGRHPLAFVQHDLIYLSLNGGENHKHMFRVDSIPRPQELISNLIEEIEQSGCQKVIISAENLWLLTPEAVTQLGAAFSDYSIQPVFFIRRFSEFVESLHLTQVRINPVYSEIFRARQDFWKDYLSLDICTAVDAWASISADGKVVVQNYDNVAVDSVKAFADLLRISKLKLSNGSVRYNESSSVLSEAIRTACGRVNYLESPVGGLAAQLSRLNFTEKFSLIPNSARSQLDALYMKQVEDLLASGKVRTTNESDWKLAASDDRVCLDGALSILFALGRAIARDDRLS